MCSKYECSELNKSEANKLTQLAGTISGQTGPIASKCSALFFSNIPETSILCQDATKKFNSTNTVKYLKAIFSVYYLITTYFKYLYSTNIVLFLDNC